MPKLTDMKRPALLSRIFALLAISLAVPAAFAQRPNERDRQQVRTVSITISIYTKKELRQDQAEEYVEAERLIVREDKEEVLV